MSPLPGIAVRAEGLDKSFGTVAAIRGLDLSIERGLIAGIIGPDGAGKSTLLRLLLGLLTPDRGTVETAGLPIPAQADAVKPITGYMPQHFSLYGDLTVAENMRFYADLHGVRREAFAVRKAELLRFSALGPFEKRLARNLSGGMQKKLALSCNLFHTPEILFLDEPTTGVDPVSRLELWRLLKELNAGGTTILLTTPYMDEAARCGRVGFIMDGRLLAYGAPEDFVRGLEDEIIEVVAPLTAAMAALRGRPGLKSVHPFGDTVHAVGPRGSGCVGLVGEALRAAGVPVRRLTVIPPSFEDVFLSLADRPSGEALR